jgi:hypothetical protein
MYRYIAGRLGKGRFEFEVSVDETEMPTSPEEHWYIAGELKRLGVRWVSLAPRFVGRFEKGVDYIGDPGVFAAEFARHVAIAQALGPYKISLHSGSDKLTVYPIVAQLSRGLVHVKTAGTSYLEALRTVAQVDPAFFPRDSGLRPYTLQDRPRLLPRLGAADAGAGPQEPGQRGAVASVRTVRCPAGVARDLRFGAGALRRTSAGDAARPRRSLLRAPGSTPTQTPGTTHPRICNLESAICNLESAICNLESAISNPL